MCIFPNSLYRVKAGYVAETLLYSNRLLTSHLFLSSLLQMQLEREAVVQLSVLVLMMAHLVRPCAVYYYVASLCCIISIRMVTVTTHLYIYNYIIYIYNIYQPDCRRG